MALSSDPMQINAVFPAVESGEALPMTAAKLAVIITCYNYQAYVIEAINSVLSQEFRDCELVVIDDGSTDNSWEAIQTTGARAFQIANGGQLAACVYGLERTTAPFVLFLDADDALVPGSLQTIVSHLDDTVAKLQFPMYRIDGDGNRLGEAGWMFGASRRRDELMAEVLETGVYKTPPTSGNVFRRDLCDVLKGVDYDRAVDGVILFAAPFFGDVVSLAEPHGLYRIHGLNDSGLGRPLDPVSLHRDLQRFSDRQDHLRRLLNDRGYPGLVSNRSTYFYHERYFCLIVAENQPVMGSFVRALITCVWRSRFSMRNKIASTVFFCLSAIMPNRQARRALAYRLNPRDRSLLGFFRTLIE